MDFTSSFIVDLVLNVLGFLVAGALALTINSIYQRRQRTTAILPEEPATEEPQTPPTKAVRRPVRSGAGEFITLGAGTAAASETPVFDGNSRRAQVIQAAREMLDKGATDPEIKSAIQVSDAELAVLNFAKKR